MEIMEHWDVHEMYHKIQQIHIRCFNKVFTRLNFYHKNIVLHS